MNVDPLEDRFLSNEDIAETFVIPIATVRRWRSTGSGPPGYRIGRHVRYAAADVRDWLESHADPVSEGAA